MTRRTPRQPGDDRTVMVPRALLAGLLTVLDERMTRRGHPFALVTQESLGTCSAWGCSDRCLAYRALFVAGEQLLNEQAEHPTQPSLFGEAAG